MCKWTLPKTVTEYVQWKHIFYFQGPNKKSTILKIEFNVSQSVLEVRKFKL